MILLTGGSGYIGSHMLYELLKANSDVLVLDNLSNSSIDAVNRVQRLTNKKAVFIQGDIRNTELLDSIFSKHPIQAVLHFAGLKAVGESVEQPLKYFDNNVTGSLTLLQVMKKNNIKRIVFSSSATVYGDPTPEVLPLKENAPTAMPTNPYGYTKLVVEKMMQQLVTSDPSWSIGVLRYFNPVGAHKSGQIGEDPKGVPNNLLPYIAQVAVGRRDRLSVFGDDYDTHDGTGVRDYIHVVDLAKGHLAALKYLNQNTGYHIWNLGTGTGYSVLDMVKAFEEENKIAIPYDISPRRAGDIASCYADACKAKKDLGWWAELGLHDMMSDTWRWQKANPNGYDK
ncbi:MAG: UDP-glucose 4-epimerase GalE [Pseudomonadales bacterium]